MDWNDHNGAVGPLSRKSFQLHEELSKELEHQIDYRKLNTLSVRAKTGAATKRKENKSPIWLDGNFSTILGVETIGNEKTTAQVKRCWIIF